MSAFDLTAARAARREASGKKSSFVFSWDGEEHAVAPSREWPVEAVSLLSEGAIAEALRLILTPEVYDSMEGLTVGDVETLFTALTEYEGLTPGNLSPRALRGTRPK